MAHERTGNGVLSDDVQGSSAQAAAGLSRLRRTHRRRWFVVVLILGDAVSILGGLLLATYLRFGSFSQLIAFESDELSIEFWQLGVVVVPLWISFLALGGLYRPDRAAGGLSSTGPIARSLSFGVVALVLATYVAKLPGLSRAWTLLLWVFCIAAVLTSRALISLGLAAARRRGRMLRSTLIVGSNSESADIVRVLKGSPEAGLVPVGCLTSSQAERLSLDYCSHDMPVLGTARELVSIAVEQRIDTIIIASSAFDHDVLARMLAEVRSLDADVHVSSGLFEVLTSRVLVTEVAGVPLITVRGLSLSRGNLLVKRVFDLVVGGAVILAGLPVWLLVATAIKLTSPGPVLYAQTRVGRDGAHFPMFKFRSMYVDADARLAELQAENEASGPLFKMRDDPRVTPVGKWMRKFSIDEFPQLLNVMRGEMSLVGPRPPLPFEVERYSVDDWRRMEVVPGMTGLWQVSGRSNLTFDEMVRLDLFYIQNWSVPLDLSLIARTVPAVLFARGAY
jgi:exopolysaccharide biosynthesis polyprenyl glycosylphosphotransferase